MNLSIKIKCGFLLAGDILLILLSFYLAFLIRIRLDQAVDIFSYHNWVVVFTTVVYMLSAYIFDLYNTNRNFRSVETVLRVLVVVIVAAILLSFLFYSLPVWQLDRGIFLIQTVLVFLFMVVWRWFFESVFRIYSKRKNILIIGAGRSGVALNKLLSKYISDYKVVGLLDDDPLKQGISIGSPKVIGTTDQLLKVVHERGVDLAIMAIPKRRPTELISSIFEARLNGVNILEIPIVFEQIIKRIPVEHIHNEWLLFSKGFDLISKQYIKKIKRGIDRHTS